ncbi:tryptophan--tRNA ligase [Candidatus Microgenomates bacterium]|nr:tryptophan--tRNA ligase [Candidatus Microgenomates bacterium]
MKNSLKEKIAEQLKRAKIEHEFIVLPEDLPSDSLSHVRYLGIAIKEAVPTILYRTEKGLIAAQRCMDSMIDEEKLKKLAGAKQLTFATKKDLEELGLESGYVPLMGLNIPYYTDRRVLELKKAYGGSGSKVFNLKISPHELVKINKAILGEFTKITTEASMKVDSKIQVYSGTRATGRLHLGNYLGAVKGYIELQQKYSCVYSVVDLHAITTPYDKDQLSQNTLNVVMDYLSAGLNTEKSFIEVQSLVPQHMELAYYLGTLYPVSRLEDLPTYKEKKAQFPKYINIGLLYYPVLMAADILLYKASLVPVGVDQEPHLEVTREIARNFNREYGETFPEPHRFATPGEYVPSLTGEGKMSKTKEGSYINLVDNKDTIKQKIARVVTDSGGPGELPKSGSVANLLKLVELFQGKETAEEYKKLYQVSGIKYQVIKSNLSEAIFKELMPIQEKRKKLEENPGEVKEMLFEHAKKLRKLAQETVDEVKEKMGFFK